MAAYAAVISLKNTIKRILEYSHISLVLPSPEILQLAFNELKLLQEILERLDDTSPSKSRTKVNALDDKIKDAVWKLEDLLESHLNPSTPTRIDLYKKEEEVEEKSCGCEKDALKFSMDLQGMRQDVDTFVDTLKKMDNLPDEEEDEEQEESIGSKIDFGGTKSEMVGLSDQFERVKQSLKKTHISLIGMAGIGKTALVAQAILAELDQPINTNLLKGMKE